MPRIAPPRALAVALLGILASAGLAGFGWYGIHLLTTQGPPLRLQLWPPYLLVLSGAVLCGLTTLGCFRLLDRWGVRPPPT